MVFCNELGENTWKLTKTICIYKLNEWKVLIIDEQNMKAIHTAAFKKQLGCRAGWRVMESCIAACLVAGRWIPVLLIPDGRLDCKHKSRRALMSVTHSTRDKTIYKLSVRCLSASILSEIMQNAQLELPKIPVLCEFPKILVIHLLSALWEASNNDRKPKIG